MTHSLRDLRDDSAVDQTLQNLLRALTLNLELRARYRVFEFEAMQDGHTATAELFRGLRRVEGEQIAALMDGLRTQLEDPGSGVPRERGTSKEQVRGATRTSLEAPVTDAEPMEVAK